MCINYKMLISYLPENYSNTVPYFDKVWPIILRQFPFLLPEKTESTILSNIGNVYIYSIYIRIFFFPFRYKRLPLEYKPRNLSSTKLKPFPSLYLDQGQNSDKSIGCEDCCDVRARQERRNKRVRPWKELNSSETMTSKDEDNENASNTA